MSYGFSFPHYGAVPPAAKALGIRILESIGIRVDRVIDH